MDDHPSNATNDLFFFRFLRPYSTNNELSNKKNCLKIGQIVQKLYKIEDCNPQNHKIKKLTTIDFAQQA